MNDMEHNRVTFKVSEENSVKLPVKMQKKKVKVQCICQKKKPFQMESWWTFSCSHMIFYKPTRQCLNVSHYVKNSTTVFGQKDLCPVN